MTQHTFFKNNLVYAKKYDFGGHAVFEKNIHTLKHLNI